MTNDRIIEIMSEEIKTLRAENERLHESGLELVDALETFIRLKRDLPVMLIKCVHKYKEAIK